MKRLYHKKNAEEILLTSALTNNYKLHYYLYGKYENSAKKNAEGR